MPNPKSDQRQVFTGILTAWFLSALFIYLGTKFSTQLGLTFATPNKALAFSLAIASVSLIVGIGWAARTRHFVSNIDGSRPDAGSALDITLRYVTNTTEQLLLFALACLCAFHVDEPPAAKLLPVMAIWFLIARAMFYIGYRMTPVARSIGFAATFHPTIALFGFILFRLVSELS
ncbi:MAG: MAPEG family protein [Rhizobiaceae bacterium]